jgi:hypothetical protein
VKGSVAASPAACVLDSTPCVVEAVVLPDAPGFEPGVVVAGVVVVVAVVVVMVVVVVVVIGGVGPGFGFGSGFGSGVGFGSGFGSGVGFGSGFGSGVLPHFALCLPFNACTSTSCPPEQGVALWGWLLPGPCSTLEPGAPFFCAI